MIVRRQTLVAALAVVLSGTIVAASLLLAATSRSGDASWPLRIAVIGDEFTAGDANRVVWPTLLAQRTGWSVANVALPKAGFAADGKPGQSFADQVDRAQAARPQLIVVVTGQADNALRDMGAVEIGVADALAKIRLGGQRALVVGPIWYSSPIPLKVAMVSEAVQRAARTARVPFLSATDPPWLTQSLMQPTLDSPTDTGHSVVADRIAQWLRTETAP